MSDNAVKLISALVDEARPVFHGHPADIIGGALADLTATWLAGHVVVGNKDATKKLRGDLLQHHIEMVLQLTQINSRMMGTES